MCFLWVNSPVSRPWFCITCFRQSWPTSMFMGSFLFWFCSVAIIKHLGPKRLRGGGVLFGLHFRVITLLGHSSSLKEVGARIQAGTGRRPPCYFASNQRIHSQENTVGVLEDSAWWFARGTICPTNGATHGGLGPPYQWTIKAPSPPYPLGQPLKWNSLLRWCSVKMTVKARPNSIDSLWHHIPRHKLIWDAF